MNLIFDKNTILKVLIALAFIWIISSGFAYADIVACSGARDCNLLKLGETFVNLTVELVKIAFSLAAIAFAYAGFLYLTSNGNQSQISKAHGIFINVLIGLSIAILSYVIVELVASAMGVTEGSAIDRLFDKFVR